MVPRQGSVPALAEIKKPVVDLSGLYKQQRKDELLGDDIKDDGAGKVQIWRVENFQLVDVDEPSYGIFWDGDSYIVLYTYIQQGRSYESFIIYFWLVSIVFLLHSHSFSGDPPFTKKLDNHQLLSHMAEK